MGIYQPDHTDEVHFVFGSKKQKELFVKWFRKEGFESLLQSKINTPKTSDDPITCLATDDKMKWGHYFELE